MKHTPETEAKRYQVTETCVAIEYPNGDKDIWGATIELNGRYPLTGYTVNEKCKELVYFISGQGKLVVGDQEILVKKGDQVVINPGEKFYWDGELVMFMPCVPAWYATQHKEVK